MKADGSAGRQPQYEDIHMPRNTSAGLFIGVFSGLLGFAAIWYIWWLAALSLLGVAVTVILRSFDNDIDYILPAAEVARLERSQSSDLMPKAAE
jgi:cytochrome o ubiquinol oxidase subunit 1